MMKTNTGMLILNNRCGTLANSLHIYSEPNSRIHKYVILEKFERSELIK